MNINNYVSINQLVLRFVGLYPTSITRYFLCIGCIMLIIVPQVTLIYTNWGDLGIVLETSSTLLTIALATFKSIIWILNRNKLESLIEFMLTDYWKLVESNMFVHLEEYATYARSITKGYFISMCNALLFFFSLPIVDMLRMKNKNPDNFTGKNFPFTATYPMIFYKSPYYQLAYLSQMLATSICCLVILATDGLIATALLHTCGHFAVLKRNMMELDSYIYRATTGTKSISKDTDGSTADVRVQVARVVKHHQIILWFCDNMEKSFHSMLLLQTITSSLIICFVGFQVSSTLTEKSESIKFISHLIVALFQLLLFCFPGDMLIRQSFSISTSAYFVKWFRSPTRVRHEISMIIQRSQRPSCITAGKLYVMHLENFTAILSSAFSYFMMLQSLNAES